MDVACTKRVCKYAFVDVLSEIFINFLVSEGVKEYFLALKFVLPASKMNVVFPIR